MALFRMLFAAVLAPLAAFAILPVTPSPAQEIGVWGMWGDWNNEKGRRHSSGRSSLRSPGQAPASSSNSGYSNTPNRGRVFPALLNGGPRPDIQFVAPDVAAFPNSEEPGTIIIDTQARTLYYTLDAQRAYAYPISVGRVGYTWTGSENISRIAHWPDWHPPKEMRQREPGLPVKMTGGLRNPLGAVAIYLGDTLYRIHGTNDPKSIGRAASSGCFRMLNNHAIHLARLVFVGTRVKIVARIEDLEDLQEASRTDDPDRNAGG